ncbi:M23 family metallopeptidase [Nocardiopsis alkaliphila]|uniref:M23 family metallopeptidase n=1 Tax=Nocardiopsis alkaliphila TaxID=225762 RepID=UPI00034C9436|nr:M23 family metallopeptidase [Nocardiopsis alkaliphila]
MTLPTVPRFLPVGTLPIIAAAALVTSVATPVSAQPAAPSHSAADNVEIIAEHAEELDLSPAAENTLTDAVIDDVLAERDTELSTLAAQERDVRVDIREASEGSAFGVAIVTAPMGADEDPHAWLFAAEHENSGWMVGLEGTEEFSSILADSALLEEKERETVAASTNPSEMAPASYIGVGLPFSIGTSMVMTGGPHGDVGQSVDFAGGAGQARAARGGYAYSLCTGWTRVIHDNGYSTDYYHLEDYQWLPGNNVGVGHYLGTQGNSLCAGGSTTGAHIHYSLRGYTDPNAPGWYLTMNGKTLGGWTFVQGAQYGGYAYRNGVGTVYPGNWMYNYGF